MLAPKEVQDSTHSHRQHHSSGLYKHERRYEIGPTVCPSLENPNLVVQETDISQGQTHSRLAECGAIPSKQSGLSFQRSSSRYCTRWHYSQIDLFTTRSSEVQVTTVSVTSARPPRLGSGCSHLAIEVSVTM